MIGPLLVWLGLFAALVVFVVGRPREGGGLVLAYALGMALIHIPGLLPFLDPSYVLGAYETRVGIHLTLIGMAAFVAGAWMAKASDGPIRPLPPPPRTFERFGLWALATGVVSYFIVLPVAARVPSLTAIVSPLGTLLVLGLWLRLYSATLRDEPVKVGQTLLVLPILPMATLSTAGFIGYGIYWVISVVAFQFVIARRRLWFYISAPIVVFLGLSLFVAYMGDRTGIRDLVWNERASLGDRLERVSEIFTHFRPLDLNSPDHVAALNDRLNQNFLVGAGVEQHLQGQSPFLHGGTIPVWSFIPRAFWPDKPAIGGGRDIVSNFTGIPFSEDTSVGAGQVLEFYMNFGVPGVVVGFAVLGFVLFRLDRGILRALGRGDLAAMVKFAMPGLTLLAPGGNLMEILIAVITSIACAYLLGHAIKAFGFGGRSPGRATAQTWRARTG